MRGIDLDELEDDLARLDGLFPYDKPENPCRNDGYYAVSLEKKYGRTLEELRRLFRNGRK